MQSTARIQCAAACSLSNEICGESISHNCEACCCLLCPQLTIYYTHQEHISHPMGLAKKFFFPWSYSSVHSLPGIPWVWFSLSRITKMYSSPFVKVLLVHWYVIIYIFGYATLTSCKNSKTEHMFCRWFLFLQVTIDSGTAWTVTVFNPWSR